MAFSSSLVLLNAQPIVAFSGPQLATEIVTLKGFTSAFDGGQGVFCWDATSQETDDGTNVIQPSSVTGSGRWLRMSGDANNISGVVNVKSFGARGDGSTNDTLALQAAIDSVRDSGGALYIPPGVYMFTNLDMTLINADFTYQVSVRGDGPKISVLRQTTPATGTALDISGSNWLRFENLGIECGPNSDVGVLASRLQTTGPNCNFNQFIDFWCTGSTSISNFYGVGAECMTHDRCWYDGGAVCPFFSGSYDGFGVTSEFGTLLNDQPNTANHVIHTRFSSSTENVVLVRLFEGAGIDFTACEFYATGANTLQAHMFVSCPNTNEFGWSVRVDKCHFEGDGNVFVFANGASPPTNAVYENFHATNNICINSGFKWVACTGSDVVHTGFVFENNVGPYEVSLAEVQRSRIDHPEAGALVTIGGAADACYIRCPEDGLTGTVLGTNVETLRLYDDEGQNYDQYGAAVGQEARIMRWVPTTTAPVAGQLSEGVVFLAKPPGWDPLSRGGTDSYFTRWTGAAWGEM